MPLFYVGMDTGSVEFTGLEITLTSGLGPLDKVLSRVGDVWEGLELKPCTVSYHHVHITCACNASNADLEAGLLGGLPEGLASGQVHGNVAQLEYFALGHVCGVDVAIECGVGVSNAVVMPPLGAPLSPLALAALPQA